ncbi:MAG: peptidoglycan recognition protein family protein [Verrucomicrobiota bacterium]|nr:peptidoglycan recognition protein family protein [Verrucomicrobiota bacterium]
MIRFRVLLATLLAMGGIVGTMIVSAQDADETPKPKHKASATPSPKKKKSASPTPKPSKTPPAKKKSKTPPPPAKKKKSSPSPSPSKKKKASPSPSPKKKKSSPSASPKKSHTPDEDEATPKPTPRPSETPAASVAQPFSRGIGDRGSVPQVNVEKSGYVGEQGYVPPPTPAPRRRGWWFWSRPETNYSYLTRSVREELDRAPVLRGRWQFIVVHNSGTRQGNARIFDYYHRHVRRMQNGLAYQFVIGNGTSTGDGQIEVGDRWRRQINGGHVHSDYLNNIALGICLVGDFNRDQPSPRQLASCEELINYLRKRCGKANGHDIEVRPHRDVNPPRWATDCPGDRFPYSWFRRF